ncbi:MAG: PilZ domain-containing protein [Candidatus Omnitrophica bacterium]|nr:PilZ domain-containing protein [Candidatus Omnitrophota bacterium]
MIEKREWHRVPVDVVAKCRLTKEGTYHHIRLTDMHHQGCRFNSPIEFGEGQEVRIVVDESVLGSLYLVGLVLWVKHIDGQEPYQTGIRFLVNDPLAVENTSKLYSYLISR